MNSSSLAGALPPVSSHPIELGELSNAPTPGAAQVVLPDTSPLHAVKARLRVMVGETEVSIGDLLAARAGQVFVLDRAVEEAVDVLLEGRIVMRGQLVAVDGHFGLRVTELPVPLLP